MLTKVCQSSLGKIDGVAWWRFQARETWIVMHCIMTKNWRDEMKVSEVAIWQPRLPSCMLHSFDKAR